MKGPHPFTGRCAPAAWLACLCLSACGPKTPPPSPDDARATELARAAHRGSLCSGREAVAAGLQAQYHAKPGFQGDPVLQRLESPIDGPLPTSGDRGAFVVRSVRWTGWVRVPFNGRYAFHGEPAAVTVRVAGQLMQGPGAAREGLELAAGRYYPIAVEWADVPKATAPPSVSLAWTAPHGARYVVPRSLLYPPTDAVPAKP